MQRESIQDWHLEVHTQEENNLRDTVLEKLDLFFFVSQKIEKKISF